MKSENQDSMEILYDRLRTFIKEENLIKNVPMGKYTSFRAGGCADMLVIAECTEELKRTLAALSDMQTEHIILGNGSNILVTDKGYRGAVIKLGGFFDNIEVSGNTITAYGGTRLSEVSRTAMENSLSGLEFACGIPGSVGGGLFMNAGAYGCEIKDVVISADVVNADGSKEYEMSAEDMQLSYRHSIFHETGGVVIKARFELQKGRKEEIAGKMKEFMTKRNSKQPVQMPSAGSFFKRPEGHFAGKLIQDAGLMGLSVGGAQVSPLHAGFIVNNGAATATDILQLMGIVQNTVYDKFGVKLEPEVRILGQR